MAALPDAVLVHQPPAIFVRLPALPSICTHNPVISFKLPSTCKCCVLAVELGSYSTYGRRQNLSPAAGKPS